MALARVLVPRLAAVLVMLGGVALVVMGLQRTAAFGGEGDDLLGRMPRVGRPVVVTAPGMLELSGATVRVRAASDSTAAPVFIGVGRAGDVEAYLDGVARSEVTALEDLQVDGARVLRVSDRAGEPSLPDPAGVDVWAASVRAVGVATLTWPRTPGRWRLVIATDGAIPPSAAEFTWSGEAGDSPAPAMLAVGALLAVVGVAGLLAMRSGRLFARTLGPDDDEDDDEADDDRDGSAREGRAREGRAREGRAREGRARESVAGEGVALEGVARRPGSARRDRRNARIAAERLESDRLEVDRLEAERLAAERRAADLLIAERLEAQRLEAQRLEVRRLSAERLEAQRLAEESREQARPPSGQDEGAAATPLPAPGARRRRPAHTGPVPVGGSTERDPVQPESRRSRSDSLRRSRGDDHDGDDHDGDEEAPPPVLPFRRRDARAEEDR